MGLITIRRGPHSHRHDNYGNRYAAETLVHDGSEPLFLLTRSGQVRYQPNDLSPCSELDVFGRGLPFKVTITSLASRRPGRVRPLDEGQSGCDQRGWILQADTLEALGREDHES